MNYKEIKRVTEIAKLVKRMKRLKAILAQTDQARRRQETQGWVSRNEDVLRRMSPQDLEEVREQADYDKEEWQRIIRELRSDTSD